MKRFLVWTILMVGMGSSALADRPLIIAHRGSSHTAPENTLAAFNLAWEQDADGIEGDFYLSADGHIVCIHDATTKRTGNWNLQVAKTTLAELRKVDVGRWKGDQFAGEMIPTLDEVLATVPDGKLIYIEIKCGPEIVPVLKRKLRETQFPLEQVRVITFSEDVVTATRAQMPNVIVNWLTSFKRNRGKWQPAPSSLSAKLAQLDASGIGTQNKLDAVSDAVVDEIHDSKRQFHVWTVDDIPEARQWQERGSGFDHKPIGRGNSCKR